MLSRALVIFFSSKRCLQVLQQTNTQKRNQIKLVTLLPRIRSEQMEVAFPYLDASHEGEDASYLETVHSVL